MTVQTQDGGYRHLPIKSSEGGLWLSKLFYDQTEKALTQHARDTAINALEAKALFAGPRFKTFQRIGRHDNSLIVDLGRDDGQLAVISQAGWSLANLADVKMIRSPAMRELRFQHAATTHYRDCGRFSALATNLGNWSSRSCLDACALKAPTCAC